MEQADSKDKGCKKNEQTRIVKEMKDLDWNQNERNNNLKNVTPKRKS